MSRAGAVTWVIGIVAVLVAGALVVPQLRDGGAVVPSPSPSPSPAASPTGTATATESSTPSPSPTPDVEEALRLLGSVEAAAGAEPEELLEAGLVAGQGPWRSLASPAWPMRGERPVYVGRATAGVDRVTADVVIAQRLDVPTEELTLRLLPAAVGANGLTVGVSVAGEPVPSEATPDGLLRIGLPGRYDADAAVAVRVELSYDVLTTADAPDDSGPAAYGILARTADVTALGHWLPVLTFEPEPIVPWGDVGSFLPAVWSLQIEHAGTLVTGGAESECPGATTGGCTWSRGLALRDVSAVLLDTATDVESVASGLRIRAVAPARIGEPALERALEDSIGSAESFAQRFGPVAWRELDVVAVPLGQGAAGVEFPGLVMIDDELYDALGGGFGTYVIVHEVAHQWFHALVGNGSFSDPVVDEPLAQYLSVLAYRDLYGPGAAQALVDQSLAARYRRFRESGAAEEPPAQASGDFAGPETYGPLVYARAPLAWLAAEDAIGEDAVSAFLAAIVGGYGLDVLSAEELVDEAAAASEELAAVLRRYWYDDEPVPVP